MLISVIIPTYNYADSLPRAIRSVVSQLTESSELIVIDDGSTDHTEQVIEKLRLDSPPPPIKINYYKKENGGVASARNLGIDKSQADYLIFLDADDEMKDGVLNLIEQHIKSNPTVEFIMAGHNSVFNDGKVKEYIPKELIKDTVERLKSYLLYKSPRIVNGGCVIHRRLLNEYRFPEKFRVSEDTPVFAQCLASSCCSTLPFSMVLIHKHANSLRNQYDLVNKDPFELVHEVSKCLPAGCKIFENKYYAKQSMAIFRAALRAGDLESAKVFYKLAVKTQWPLIFNPSYTRKAIRLWLKTLVH